jgi:hypothetical protein
MTAVLRSLFLTSIVAVTSTGASTSFAAEAPLFASQEPLAAVLSVPLNEIYREADEDEREQMAGSLSYTDATGAELALPVRVRTRGVFRRANCSRPPLRLNFKKSDLDGSLFDGQDKLKLVNPCDPNSRSEQQLALEYLAYKLYEEISDASFRTRLMSLTLEDSSGKRDPWTTVAFVIEDEGELLKRLDGEPLAAPQARRSQMDLAATSRVELFQYLIGNTDFSMYVAAPERDCCHNTKLVNKGDEEAPLYIPVPYDFDSSGLVNARYAKPPPFLPIKRVTQRYFMGYCRDPQYLDDAVAYFKERREELLAVFESELLTDKTRKRALKFVDKFFEVLDSPKKVERELAEGCRGEMLVLSDD